MEKRAITPSRSLVDRVLLAAAALLCGHAAVAGPDDPAFIRSIADSSPPSSASAAAVSSVYYLEAMLNGVSSNLIVSCEQRAGTWWMPVKHLRALGLRVDDLQPDREGWVSLAAVSGLRPEYEAASQRLHLTVLASRRNLNVIRQVPTSRDGDATAGFLLNYDTLAEWQDGESVFHAYTEQRAFGGYGVFSNRGTLTADGGEQDYLRLETFWTYSDPETLRSYSAGDLISRSLGWSRSARLGGLQLRRNFALRPDLITYPVADFSGEVAVPSTIDVYVNQVRQLTSPLPAGPFRIETPPSLNGAGQATLVVRDMLGRETIQTLDLYVVPQLLAEGLYDYSFEAGQLREEFGSRSREYAGGVVGSASFRYGMSERFTIESHAERASGLLQFGMGALWQVGLYGRVNASFAVSDGDSTGEQYGIGYQFVSASFNLTADYQRVSRAFRDLPSLLGDLPARRQARVIAGRQLGPRAHMSASYVETEGALDGVETRLASIGYRQNLGRHASLYFNAFRDFEQENGDGFYLGCSMAVGESGQLHSEYASQEERSGVTYTSRSPYAGGWDWLARASHADDNQFQAASRYTGDLGSVSADFARDEGAERWQLGARGALVIAGSHFVAGRYVQDEFALVSTNGLGGVPVLHENRPVGHTNDAGLLLLANVNAYQPNLVAIDPLAVPFGYRIDSPDRLATPKLAAGTVVRFGIDKPRAGVLVLVDGSGVPLPAGSAGELLDQGTGFTVGYDGVVYLSGLSDVNRVRVQLAGGSCEAEFRHDAASEAQADLGRVSCR